MPELPEVDHLRRSLEPVLAGAVVGRVQLRRADIVRTAPPARLAARSLLQGLRIAGLSRHGKELAIVTEDGRSICVHLGMSGQLWFCPHGRRLARHDHVHCVWRLETPRGRLVFRDPRRFGGLWTYESFADLQSARWDRLGPDALTVDARTLRRRLARTRRVIKVSLLDQRVIAGIGNIYADEILFAARLHPASRVPADRCRLLARSIRQVLSQAIAAGGSTIRDYMDGRGQPGSYARQHKVYGRAGQPCRRCDTPLETRSLGQRTTVFCPGCQDLFSG